jgi:intein-encoded DNA endonuclease-like protein
MVYGMDGELDYIAGVVKGDGSLYYNKKAKGYVVEIYDRDREFIELLAGILRTHGFNYSIRSYGTYYRLRINSRELHNTLARTIERLILNPTIPFIRGLFDAEGTLYFDKRKARPYPIVELGTTDQRIISATAMTLTRLGLKYSIKSYKKPNRRELYKIVLRGSNVIIWAKIVRPLHPVKFSLLYTLIL